MQNKLQYIQWPIQQLNNYKTQVNDAYIYFCCFQLKLYVFFLFYLIMYDSNLKYMFDYMK